MIRMVLKDLKPTNADCEKFLDKLWLRHDEEYPPNEDLLPQLAKMYFQAAANLGDPVGTNNFRAAKIFLACENFACAYAYGKRSLEIRQAVLPKFDHRLAEVYLVTGLTAAVCIMNAVIIYEQTAAEGEKLAEAYRALALVCEKLNDFAEAASLAEKVLRIFESTPPKNQFKLARIHGELGRYLKQSGNFDDSLRHLQTSASILESLTPQGHLNVALAYRAIGELYKCTEKFDEAFHYGEKAIQMQERPSRKNFGELGNSYRFIGDLYRLLSQRKGGDISNLQKSTEQYQMAIRMRNEAMLPLQLRLLKQAEEEDNDKNMIVKRYRGAADCCRTNQRFREAEKKNRPDGNFPYVLLCLANLCRHETI